MNAATRAVVRCGVGHGLRMLGVRRGYAGLIAGDFIDLGLREVGGIIHQGGTMLSTSRCEEFKSPEGQHQALERMRTHGVRRLPVVDDEGYVLGIVTLDDLLRVHAGQAVALLEIVTKEQTREQPVGPQVREAARS